NFLNNAATLTGSLNGAGGTNSIVYAVAVTTNLTFNVTGANSGNVAGAYSFVNIQNLTGGSGNDQFSFSAGASLGGTIDGGPGFDTILVNGGILPPGSTFTFTVTATAISGPSGRITFYASTFEQLVVNAAAGQRTRLIIDNGVPGSGTLVAFPATGAPMPPPFGILYACGGVRSGSSLPPPC